MKQAHKMNVSKSRTIVDSVDASWLIMAVRMEPAFEDKGRITRGMKKCIIIFIAAISTLVIVPFNLYLITVAMKKKRATYPTAITIISKVICVVLYDGYENKKIDAIIWSIW